MANEKHALFYGSENHDRKYGAKDLEDWLKKFFTSGTFVGDLQVTAPGGMQVSIGLGYINIDGKVRNYDEIQTLDITNANATYDRIDNIVVERRDADRDFFVKVVTGSATSTPTPPVRVWEDGVYQMVLAQVRVAAGSTAITQANITDTRADSTLCGFVAATVEQIDFSQIQAQYDSFIANYMEEVAQGYADYVDDIEGYEAQAESVFGEWFERMKGQLSADAAGNLQNQIDDITDEVAFPTQRKVTTFPDANHIQQTLADGRKKIYEFAADSIIETLYDANDAAVKTKTTTITANSIIEEVE